jgi:hypothetical protein
MKKTVRLGALAMFMVAAGVAAEMRTLHLESGATLEAEIVAFPTADTVQVKKRDGKMATLPIAYLVHADRDYVEVERAHQWKEVSIDKLLGTASAGRYKKCAVSGKYVGHEILAEMLPAKVETILKNRQQQETQITNLNNRIKDDSTVAHNANASAASGANRAYRNANRVEARLATRDETEAKTALNKLKADYAEYVKKTKADTTVRMRNTGLVYEGLPVWECQVSQKR